MCDLLEVYVPLGRPSPSLPPPACQVFARGRCLFNAAERAEDSLSQSPTLWRMRIVYKSVVVKAGFLSQANNSPQLAAFEGDISPPRNERFHIKYILAVERTQS